MGQVLIIDADEGFANDLVSVLNGRGIDVQVTPDGKAGLDLARINIPDAIVLCVELPRMSGYSICAKLKKDTTLKTVPLIITSAEATQETFEHHKKLKTRAEEYLKKPFAPDELVNVLSSYVSMSNGSAIVSENIAMDDEVGPETLEDDEVFNADEGSGMASIDQEIQNLKKQRLPPPDVEDEEEVFQEGFDDEEGRTTIGGPREEDLVEIQRLKSQLADERESRQKAERERDLAMANEKSATSQITKMSGSQPPTSGGREVLELKKQINARDRELLDLRGQLQEKQRDLLSQRDKEMELEGQVVEAQEAASATENIRTQLEAKMAGMKANLQQIERASAAKIADLEKTSAAKIGDLDRQLAAMNTQAAELDSTVQTLTQEIHEAKDDIQGLTSNNQNLQSKVAHLNNELQASRTEAGSLRQQLEGAEEAGRELKEEIGGLRTSLDSANEELRTLRSTIEDAEDRLSRAYQKIREDEEVKAKAKKALEIASALLVEAGFSADNEQAEDARS